MNVAHTFLTRIKHPAWLIVACAMCFLTIFILLSWSRMSSLVDEMDCHVPFSFYRIHENRSIIQVTGLYHHTSHSGRSGKTSYDGRITYIDAEGKIEKWYRAHREIDWQVTFKNRRAVVVTTGNNKLVGDRIDDELTREFIFPAYKIGQPLNAGVFLLNGKVLASGPENIPRTLCH